MDNEIAEGGALKAKYVPVESAMFILDFRDAELDEFSWLLEDGTLAGVIRGMTTMGIGNIQLRCDSWLHMRRIVEAIGGSETLKTTSVVPFDAITEDCALDGTMAVSIALRLDVIDHVKDRVEHYAERIKKVSGGLPRNARFVSAVLPVSRGGAPACTDVVKEFYDRTGLSVILDPRIDPLGGDDSTSHMTWQELDGLYGRMIDLLRTTENRKLFLMDLGLLPTRLLTEHPCNAYVCSGSTCHSGKSDLPRRLVLLPDGTIVPEHRGVNRKLALGDIKQYGTIEALLNGYAGNERHRMFLEVAKKIYVQWVLPCPFRVVPWVQLLIASSHDL